MKKTFAEIESRLETAGQLIETFKRNSVSLDGKAREIVDAARADARQFGLSTQMINAIETDAAKKVRS